MPFRTEDSLASKRLSYKASIDASTPPRTRVQVTKGRRCHGAVTHSAHVLKCSELQGALNRFVIHRSPCSCLSVETDDDGCTQVARRPLDNLIQDADADMVINANLIARIAFERILISVSLHGRKNQITVGTLCLVMTQRARKLATSTFRSILLSNSRR